MTVVLPAPVASFNASRINSGLASLFAAARCSSTRLPVAELGGDLGQPDRGLYGFDLTEKRADAAELCVASAAVAGQFPGSPATAPDWAVRARFDVTSNLIDDRSRIVLLLFGRQPLAFVEDDLLLRAGLVFLRLRDRRDEFGAAASLEDLLRRLASSSSSQCRIGYRYGEFRIGWSKNGSDMTATTSRAAVCRPPISNAKGLDGPTPLSTVEPIYPRLPRAKAVACLSLYW